MPYYKKRKLVKFIQSVVDNEAETKRLVQTRERNWVGFPDHWALQPILNQNGNADDWFKTSGRENYYSWALHSNTPSFWPVALHPLAKGVDSGYAPDSYGILGTDLHNNHVRIGSEVKIKGISLEFMTWLKPQLPHGGIKVSFIRFAKGDTPSISKLYKNYTAVKPLDMIDNRRFKIMKTWKFFHRQSQPSTAGSEMASQMFTGNNMNSDAYDGDKLEILQDLNGKTWADWETYIEDNYPGHRIWAYDDLPYNNDVRNQLEAKLALNGLSSTLETGIVRYAPSAASFQPTQLYGTFRDNGDVGSNMADPLMLAAYTYIQPSYYMVSEGLTSSPTVNPQQIILVKKADVGALATGPTQGQILIPMDKKHKLWIPGHLFGNGGEIRFKEAPFDADLTYEKDGFFDHCLMFETYSNFKTWSYDTLNGGTYPEVFRISDFLQVTYFKDF